MLSGKEGQTGETLALLGRMRAFCFPGGEEAARRIRAIRTTEKGEMRMSPEAPWVPFTAEQFTDSTRSSFRWDARIHPGKISSAVVTDAYEEGHGRLAVRLGGVLPLQKFAGPDSDQGELQRYFGSIAICPPILLNHPSLDWTAVAPATLRVRDREDRNGSTVDMDIGDDGRPLGCHADRPAMVGKKAVLTPWSASCSDFREWEGLRVPTRLDATWHRAEGLFLYFRTEILSFVAVQT